MSTGFFLETLPMSEAESWGFDLVETPDGSIRHLQLGPIAIGVALLPGAPDGAVATVRDALGTIWATVINWARPTGDVPAITSQSVAADALVRSPLRDF